MRQLQLSHECSRPRAAWAHPISSEHVPTRPIASSMRIELEFECGSAFELVRSREIKRNFKEVEQWSECTASKSGKKLEIRQWRDCSSRARAGSSFSRIPRRFIESADSSSVLIRHGWCILPRRRRIHDPRPHGLAGLVVQRMLALELARTAAARGGRQGPHGEVAAQGHNHHAIVRTESAHRRNCIVLYNRATTQRVVSAHRMKAEKKIAAALRACDQSDLEADVRKVSTGFDHILQQIRQEAQGSTNPRRGRRRRAPPCQTHRGRVCHALQHGACGRGRAAEKRGGRGTRRGRGRRLDGGMRRGWGRGAAGKERRERE